MNFRFAQRMGGEFGFVIQPQGGFPDCGRRKLLFRCTRRIFSFRSVRWLWLWLWLWLVGGGPLGIRGGIHRGWVFGRV